MDHGLQSRFAPPQPRRDYIRRPRLFEKLKQYLTLPVTGIFANAGCGKTTLVSSFMKEYEWEPLWFTLDETGDDAAFFWNSLFHLFPSLQEHEDLAFMLEQHLKQEEYYTLLEYAIPLMKEKEHILVLDNVHVLHDPLLLSSLQYFLQHLPSCLHVILMGREEHEVSLYTQMLEGNVGLLSALDLNFREDEAMAFLKKTLHCEEGDEQLQMLCHKADGWIGGLQLLVMANGENSSAFSRRMLNEYITQEIMMPLPAHVREFLIDTSIFHSFDIELARAYMQDACIEDILQFLLKQNFIITTLDEEHKLYAYHDILRDYLITCFDECDSTHKKECRHRGSELCLQRNDIQECLYLLFSIPDYHQAMEVLSTQANTADTLRYLRKVPRSLICENPDFAYQYYFYYYGCYEESECREIYRQIEEQLYDTPGFAAFANSFAIIDTTGVEKSTVLSISQLHKLPLKEETISFMLLKDAYLLYAHNHFRECRERLDEVDVMYRKSKNLYTGSMLYMEYAQLHEEFGQFQEALRDYEKMKWFIEQLHQNEQSYEIGLAGIYIKQMRLEEADELLNLCEQRQKTNSESLTMAGVHTRAQWYCAKEDYDEAEKLLDIIQKTQVYSELQYRMGLLKLLYEQRADMAVYHEIEQLGEAGMLYAMDRMDGCLCWCQLLLHNKEYDKALGILDQLLQMARKEASMYVLVEADLLKLRVLWHMKHENIRLQNDLFMEAFMTACPQMIRLPFLILRHDMDAQWARQMVNTLRNLNQQEQEFLKSLQLPFGHHDILTLREIEVLHEIAEGRSNKEICEQLCISLSTVKTHIISIYGKLAISHRVEAAQYYQKHYAGKFL